MMTPSISRPLALKTVLLDVRGPTSPAPMQGVLEAIDARSFSSASLRS
jgi:hypothetical protein